jgi:hypothetical protein
MLSTMRSNDIYVSILREDSLRLILLQGCHSERPKTEESLSTPYDSSKRMITLLRRKSCQVRAVINKIRLR